MGKEPPPLTDPALGSFCSCVGAARIWQVWVHVLRQDLFGSVLAQVPALVLVQHRINSRLWSKCWKKSCGNFGIFSVLELD
jgi:hypothetical protein